MRLWSLHPACLDTQGLLACWREGLLARKVLLGQTRGYKNHPQLQRFKACPEPVEALDRYLLEIHAESLRRGFTFNRDKIGVCLFEARLTVTDGQLQYEWGHLKQKLLVRAPERYERMVSFEQPRPHPLFLVLPGGIEPWERLRV
jgi:hypothetical protein